MVVLIGTAIGVVTQAGQAGVANPGAHGFSEILYAFTSAGNNNGSAFGGLSANLPNEFIQETEVISGGYNAEYGRATGGIINVVTKTGSNEFHGSVFGYYQPGALVSAAKTVQHEGGSIDSADTGRDMRNP